MSIITLPNQLTNGTVADASQVMTNLNQIVNDYNGNINNSNLSSSIAITDSHLNQITTAGKVSGTALTSLASIPSGAGVVPMANLPPQGTIFGAWTVGVVGTIYQAATDGIVLGFGSGASQDMKIITDSSATPTTIRSQSSTSSQIANVFSPVKKNDYYQVTVDTSTGTMFFLPIGT